jgi:hypothetical protein
MRTAVLAAVVGLALLCAALARAEGTFVAGVDVDPLSRTVHPTLEFSLPERYAGRDVRFRVCWVNRFRRTVCVSRTKSLLGTDTSSVIANIRLRPLPLRRWTTFRWSFEGRQVAKVTARVKR